jgi:K+-sensing histidine kinase KdpD
MTGCTPQSLHGRTIREAQCAWADILEPLISSAIETGRPVPEFVLGPPRAAAGIVGPEWRGQLSTIQGSTGVVLAITLVVEPLGEVGRLHSTSVVNECRGTSYGPLEMLAHDYRNRLAPILSAAQMIQKYGAAKPEILDWAGTSIERQVREMTDDLNDLIDLAQLTLGEAELHMQTVDLRPILERMRETAGATVSDVDLRLNVDLEPQAFTVFGDPTRLEQALRRLFRYVAKSLQPEAVVALSAELAAGQVVIRIGEVDCSPSASEVVWTCRPFVDPRAPRITTSGGFGPGLTLANQLILRHGGTLSGPERGTDCGVALTIRIPVLNQDAQRVARSDCNTP